MKKSIGLFAVVASLIVPSIANADLFVVGGSFDLGVPDGLGVGVTAQPWTHLFRAGVSFQENVVSPGAKASVVFDPIKFPVAPELQVDLGWFSRQNIPFNINGVSNLSLQYNYVNLLFGVAFGNRDKALFTLSGGASYIDASIGGLNQYAHVSNAFFNNPEFRGFIPAGKLGVIVFFN